jgi:hypothetical protein
LELYHGFGQSSIRDLESLPLETDRIILAVNAAEVAVGEKNGPGSSLPDKRSLFPKMRGSAGNLHPSCRLAVTSLSCHAVHAAIPRAKMAVFVDRIQLFHPVIQFTAFMESEIRGEYLPARSSGTHEGGTEQAQRLGQKSPSGNITQSGPLLLSVTVININHSLPFSKSFLSGNED